MIIEPESLIANYREWIGIRFLHQGRSRLGVDCLGFIAAGAAEVGSNVFLDHLPPNYGRDPQSILIEGLEKLTRKIDLQPGALVTVRWPLTQFASHAMIYTGESIVHAFQSVGRVVETQFGDQWRSRMTAAWAIPLVKYK